MMLLLQLLAAYAASLESYKASGGSNSSSLTINPPIPIPIPTSSQSPTPSTSLSSSAPTSSTPLSSSAGSDIHIPASRATKGSNLNMNDLRVIIEKLLKAMR